MNIAVGEMAGAAGAALTAWITNAFVVGYSVLVSRELFLFAVLTIAICALFFIVCRKYEEGLVGNFFLGLLIVACSVMLWDAWRGIYLEHLVARVIVVCLAVFMARHGYRFAMFHWHGFFGWTPPADPGRPARQAAEL
jgi:hypothetical protein